MNGPLEKTYRWGPLFFQALQPPSRDRGVSFAKGSHVAQRQLRQANRPRLSDRLEIDGAVQKDRRHVEVVGSM